jgi:hypothetical protein
VFKTRTKTYQIAYDPTLVPPLELMRQEGIDVLEEWFRWGEEWSMLVRVCGMAPVNRGHRASPEKSVILQPARTLLQDKGKLDY